MNESKNAQYTEPSPDLSNAITVEVFGRTDVGLVREHNEDNFLVADLTAGNRSIRPEVRSHCVGPKGSIFTVCDGMGGAAAGEVASQIGVDTIYDMMQQGDPPADDTALAQRLEKALCEAGRRILTAARLNRTQRGMGTTVTAAVLIDERLIVGQVGDSRAYILRNEKFVQITKDQSLVQQLIDAKQMTEEEARTFDKNNIILQALGTAEEVHVDVTSTILKRGDTLVMCSDGLSGLVDNDAIREIVLNATNPMEACRHLTEAACEAGGHDNITVIVAVFGGEALKPPPDEGRDDSALIYERFHFSRSAETTNRAPRPREKERDNTQRVREDAPPKKSKAPADLPEPPQKKRSPVFGILVAVILFVIGTLVFFSYKNKEARPSDTLAVPPASQVSQPQPQPQLPTVLPQQNPLLEPPKVEPPPLQQAAAVPTPLEPPSTEGEANDEPALAPTPEEAIMKGPSPGDRSSSKERSESRRRSRDKRASKVVEDPDETAPDEGDDEAEGAGDEVEKDKEPDEASGDEETGANEDDKTGEAGKTDKTGGGEGAASNKNSNADENGDPKPIEDNPFD